MADSGTPTAKEVIHASDITNNYYTKSDVNNKYLFTKIKYYNGGQITIPLNWKKHPFAYPEVFNKPVILAMWLCPNSNNTGIRYDIPRAGFISEGDSQSYFIYNDTHYELITQGSNIKNDCNGWYVFSIIGDLA